MPELDIPADSDLSRLLVFLNAARYEKRDTDDYSGRIYLISYGTETLRPGHVDEITYDYLITLPGGLGCLGFECVFFFAQDGALISHGAWE
jgi:hypothetical protein